MLLLSQCNDNCSIAVQQLAVSTTQNLAAAMLQSTQSVEQFAEVGKVVKGCVYHLMQQDTLCPTHLVEMDSLKRLLQSKICCSGGCGMLRLTHHPQYKCMALSGTDRNVDHATTPRQSQSCKFRSVYSICRMGSCALSLGHRPS